MMTPETFQQFLDWRDIRTVCEGCHGSGHLLYGNTSTWRGGIGGASMTSGVCDHCWGSGDADNHWTDLRKLDDQRREMNEEQCAKWFCSMSGLTLQSSAPSWQHLIDRLELEQNRRKFPEGIQQFWYLRTVEALQNVLKKFVRAEKAAS